MEERGRLAEDRGPLGATPANRARRLAQTLERQRARFRIGRPIASLLDSSNTRAQPGGLRLVATASRTRMLNRTRDSARSHRKPASAVHDPQQGRRRRVPPASRCSPAAGRPTGGWRSDSVGAAGGLGGFFPPLVMGIVKSATGRYALGCALMALACLVVLRVPRAAAAASISA